jgi:hypothetical protein
VKVEGPSGQVLPVSLKSDAKSGPNVYLSFIPRDAGEHLIHLVFNGMPLSGSPFKTKVYNIKEICVKEMPKEIVVGKPVTFLGEKKEKLIPHSSHAFLFCEFQACFSERK